MQVPACRDVQKNKGPCILSSVNQRNRTPHELHFVPCHYPHRCRYHNPHSLAVRITPYTIPCPVWMKGMLDSPHSGEMSERTQKTIRRLDLRPGLDVLDVGCGPGRLTIPISSCSRPQRRSHCDRYPGGDARRGPESGKYGKSHQYPFSSDRRRRGKT